jgi:hypothetical protein
MIKHLKQKYRYFHAWLRYRPPSSLTSAGWRLFDEEFKSVAPVRYWFTHTLRYSCLMPVKWKYENITSWVSFRTTHRYHTLDTGLPPGYYGVDDQLLHVSFNALKNFVEKDLAFREHWCSDVKKSWCERHMPFYRHLAWASALDDPSLPPYEQSPTQARQARETVLLYKWWMETRPARVEPVIRHPTDDMFDIFNPRFRTTKEYKTYRSDILKATKIRAAWDKEDDSMLIRLMKIRRGLWA